MATDRRAFGRDKRQAIRSLIGPGGALAFIAAAYPEEIAAIAAAENMTREEYLERDRRRHPPWAPELTAEELKRVVRRCKAGEARRNARRAIPVNSSSPMLRAVNQYDAALIGGTITARGLKGLYRWLKQHHPRLCPDSPGALRRAIYRARNKK